MTSKKTVAHDVHPSREHDKMGVLLDDELGNLYVIVVPRFVGMCFEKRLERKVRGGYWWVGVLGTGEAVCGFSV